METLESSSFGRLIGVLVSPGKTFRAIAERPTWAVPFVLFILLTTGVAFLVSQRIDMEQAIRQRLGANQQQLSQEQLDRMVEQAKKFGPIAAVASAAIGTPLVYLAIAGVFLVLFRLFGSEIDYLHSLSVWMYGLAPWLIATLLSIPIILSRTTIEPTAAQRGILLSNLTFLAPEGAKPSLLTLLSSLDLFSVWTIVLLIIGYRVAARVSATVATAVVIGLWALYVAGRVGLTAAFG